MASTTEETLARGVEALLHGAASRLGLTDGERDWLIAADRELHVKVPVAGDDGELRVYDGYRVQHSNVRGPYKGGLRLDAEVSLEETRALAQLMTLKTAAADLPLIAFLALSERAGCGDDGARVAVQGTGNVGIWAARLLAERGCRVVAMSKSDATAVNESGLDVEALASHLAAGEAIGDFRGADVGGPDDVLDVGCDVFIPAARGGMIDESAAERLSCRMLIEGANGPLTPAAERALRDDSVLVVPDLLANTGGVIVSYFEWLQNRRRERWHENEVDVRLEQTMHAALVAAADRAERDDAGLRAAAYDIAIERVIDAARLRGRLG